MQVMTAYVAGAVGVHGQVGQKDAQQQTVHPAVRCSHNPKNWLYGDDCHLQRCEQGCLCGFASVLGQDCNRLRHPCNLGML